MLSQRDYNKFNIKMTHILKDCNIKEPTENMPVFIYSGCSTQTKDNVYYYDEKKAKEHIGDLLEICKLLPKMENSIIGTAGTIAFSDLLTDTKIPGLLKKQLVTADHFINLMTLVRLALPQKNDLSSGGFVTHLELHYSLKEKLKENPAETK